MYHQARFCSCRLLLIGIAWGGLAWGDLAGAQELPSTLQAPPHVPQVLEHKSSNVAAPCVEPPPLPSVKDYNGPLNKTVVVFARALERKSVHPPHYKPGVFLCSLELKDKFVLFVQDSLDSVTFLSTGFWAGMDQASDKDRTFGQGAAGYGKRFGANFADQVSSKFLKDFAYPAIFSEDPRYYRLVHGTVRKRLLHAVGHVFVAYRVDGTHMPNYSEWLGTVSAVTLSNAYHPGNNRGMRPAGRRAGYSIIQDMGFDVLREFWPEISRKFDLPFRGAHEVGAPESVSAEKDAQPNSN
jgi:hypothetical protein